MNRVEISCEEVPLPPWSASLKQYVRKVLVRLGRDKWDLSVLLCGNKTITELNARYRGKPEATDVLSFSLGTETSSTGRFLPGDIVISLDMLRDNSGRFNISEDEELRRLLIHGILHLDGMDHRGNSAAEPMLQFQEQILADLAGEHIIGRNV